MARLEDLRKGAKVSGILPNTTVSVVDVHWHGSDVVELTYKDAEGNVGTELLFRDREPTLEIESPGSAFAFDSDGNLFRIVSEAYRIRMAYLFDPWLAVHLSLIEPLPHQITAVYGEMLPRQPLRFLLADDPGAGKTIMTGLYIKELMLRGDLERCLIITPGNLVEQWQDELQEKFSLPFEILTNERIEAARTGNALAEMDLVLARLDKLSRDENLHPKLDDTDWDLIVVDEAHKMSAHIFGTETRYTKRYRLGQKVSQITRHFLLLTATPHNGKEEDFQLFLALLDPDRFEGRYREGIHRRDANDLMRRMVKEDLYRFNGTRLFPERKAYTVSYQLSEEEAALYHAVTTYVTEEFNRAEAVLEEGRRGTVGFALTILQRRLASSPEAIYKSLRRRRERLEERLRESKLLHRGAETRLSWEHALPELDEETLEDLEDAPAEELEEATELVVDLATTAQTIQELEAEITTLKRLERLADTVRRSGTDRKWTELASLLQDNPAMFDDEGNRRKIVIFTEHRDTLDYLARRLATLLGKPECIITIHGSMRREERRAAQEAFVQDKTVQILVATDAAGEGINLQRANLMVNYDLPWNPVRLEQRFGRIHRIGQIEVCHMWNLVADETREGDVYKRLLQKIEQQRESLGDRVFDILGKLFHEQRLRDLLVQAIRYGDRPEVRAKLHEVVDNLADQERCRKLLEEEALARESMDLSKVQQIRQDMERAQARRLQPHFIASFFKTAFAHLGGSMHERESGRYEISRVPAAIRNQGIRMGGRRVLPRYQRVTFHKEKINIPGKPLADFLAPGHPLLDATIDLLLERYRELLRRGALLVDPSDPGQEPRALLYLEHAIRDGRKDRTGSRRVVSRQMQFVEINAQGEARDAGPAPFLDYKPITGELPGHARRALEDTWLKGDLEAHAIAYAVQHIVPRHLQDVKSRREDRVNRTMAAVKDRLTKEIAYWDHRAQELKAREEAGKSRMRLSSDMARRRADELQARLGRRLEELEEERQLAALPPVVVGGAIIVPQGLLEEAFEEAPQAKEEAGVFGRQRALIEAAAMQAVMEHERRLGNTPRDVSGENLGWDIESAIAGNGRLRFIEVKGRIKGATTVTVSKNEILAALNKPEDFILALVEVEVQKQDEGEPEARPVAMYYAQQPFHREPDFAVTSVNYSWKELIEGRSNLIAGGQSARTGAFIQS